MRRGMAAGSSDRARIAVTPRTPFDDRSEASLKAGCAPAYRLPAGTQH